MQGLREFYSEKKGEISRRLIDFSKLKNASKERLFYELCFCIMAVQTSGIRSWEVAKKLREKDFFSKGMNPKKILREGYIRFHNTKSDRLLEAQQKFNNIIEKIRSGKDPEELRDWLAENVKGFGMKESSHFLRNIGRADDLAILDRHILRNMERQGFITEIPKTLTKKKYLEVEESFKRMAKELKMKPAELDLLLWAKETGIVFK